MADTAILDRAAMRDAAPTLEARPSGQKIAVPPPVEAAREGEVLPPKRKRRILMPIALLAAVGFGSYEGYRWFVEGRFIVSTDDAYVKADMATLAAKVSGYITTVAVTDNQQVKAGDLLVQIDPIDYRLAADAAQRKIDTQVATIARIGAQAEAQRAMIDQARAQLAASEADRTRSSAELERTVKLVQSSYGTAQRLEQAQADRDRTIATVGQSQAAVAAATANLGVLDAQKLEAERMRNELQTALDRANRDLSFTEIRAPFDGVIGNRAAQPGQYVQPGTRILALVPMDSVYIEANFKETQLGRLKPGQKATVTIDAFSDRSVEASVESFAPASGAQFSLLPPENATGNFTKVVQRVPVRLKVPAAVAREGVLRPGLSVVVDVRTKSDEPVDSASK